MGIKASRVLSLTWRDENYGRIYQSTAFRHSMDTAIPDTTFKKMERVFKKSGYEFNWNRCSWIAEYGSNETPLQLIEKLTQAGFETQNFGCVPECLTEKNVTPECLEQGAEYSPGV